MTEVRPLRAEELEPFLRLLCQVFDVNFDFANAVFINDPMFDLTRLWGLFEQGTMVSCLTTRPLEFGWGRAVGIAGVATLPERQREGRAGQLMERVLRENERAGEGPALLFAHRTELYEKLGFERLDRVVRATVRRTTADAPPAEVSAVKARYDAWAARSPERLRRDDRRWAYWQWRSRTTVAAGEAGAGYATLEAGLVREALGPGISDGLPVPEGTEALALTYMIDRLELPFEPTKVEMYLMGRNIPTLIQMFMTDQF